MAHDFKDISGERVPQATFKIRKNGKFEQITTDDVFKGKNVIVFSLPGAFTPTCSSTHLPRYNDLAATFQAQGIDSIVCLSVNDCFVMEAWAKDQESENVFLLPDGNGEFTEKMGLLVDKSDLGFGKRSWRYSMLVRDGHIEKMFIEPDKPGDPFEVSDADTMLQYLKPGVEAKAGAVVFTKEGCPHCSRAKELLEQKKISFKEISGQRTNTLKALGGKGTYPLVFLAGEKVGSADDLEQFLKKL